MKMIPKYAENIIVGTICDHNFSWYVTEKDFWFLDLYALKEAYRRKGYDIDINDGIRGRFPVLDKDSFIHFRQEIQDYLCSTSDLRGLLIALKDDSSQSWIYEMRPSLLIDFDNRVLYNFYYEPEAFENLVPKGWTGLYQNFYNNVPVSEQYWISENGTSICSDEKEIST